MDPAPVQMAKLLHDTQLAAAAALAGGMIAATGRAHSVHEAKELLQDVLFALFPQPNHGAYQAWEKDNSKVTKPHE